MALDRSEQWPVGGVGVMTLEKSWESADGIVTVRTERHMPTAETPAQFVERHRADVAEMMELCPPIE